MREEWYKTLRKKAEKTNKPYLEWAKKEGFTHIKQSDIFGHYFKADKDGFANKIKWVYDDSTDMHYVKWQSWIGNESPRLVKINPVPERKDGIYLEAETDQSVFSVEQFASYRMLEYIKENNNKMIKDCKDNINKRLKSLIN